LLEQADNGTLFLDEIGEMPLDVQAKLLKAIEEQRFRRVGGEHLITVDVQIFAASNQNLEKMVVEGDFRQDLYHRLNVFQIEVPALREYKSDLIELVPLIIADLNAKSGKKVGVISDQAWRDLMDYEWPGNIRELRNALERGVLLAQDDTLNTSWLKLNNNLLVDQLDAGVVVDQAAVERRPDNVAQLNVVKSNQLSFTLDGKTSLEDMDRKIIETALKVSQQNISKAADLIGATRETLRYRIQKYELDVGADSA
jgi:DNA-binding NtrC family response regulator